MFTNPFKLHLVHLRHERAKFMPDEVWINITDADLLEGESVQLALTRRFFQVFFDQVEGNVKYLCLKNIRT